ncbi:MAG: PH domain-containing protein [Bacteroidia bacterium]
MTVNIIYTASLDNGAKIITILALAISAGLCFWSIRSLRKAAGDITSILIHSFIILLLISVITGSYIYSPRKYVLGNFDIAISRPAGDVVIHVKDILEIRPVKEYEMEGTGRTFGAGGLFGYYGNYYNKRLGDMKWYATRQDNLVIIHTKQGETIIISPDDKDFTGRILAKQADL